MGSEGSFMPAACRSLDEDQIPPSRPKQSRERLAHAAILPLTRAAANDGSAQSTRPDGPELHGIQRLDEIILEMVRREVRAEVARTAAIAPASPKYVSVAEYAEARSISASTVRNAIRSGRLPALRFGAAVRVPAEVEIGKPIAANANHRAPSPAARAEQIVAVQRARSSSPAPAMARSDLEKRALKVPL
jgi:excisionase family DNA binding protein